MSTSVVMATYNGFDFILAQMECIRFQTIKPDEVIFCDDKSKDHTVTLIQSYIAQYNLANKWRVIQNEHNLGYGANFKKAADLATGDYIFFADQDDLWEKDKIERMVTIMEQHPDCYLLSTDYEPFSDDGYEFTVPAYIRKKMPDNGQLEHLTLSDKTIYIGALGCCMCVRREFRDRIAQYYCSGWSHDDRFWRLGLCSGGSYILHSNLTKHRIHDHNTATFGKLHDKDKRIANYTEVKNACAQMMAYLHDINAPHSELQLVRKHYKMIMMRIDLIEKKHLWNAVPLIVYLPHYLAKKSWLVDVYVALRG